MTLDKIIKWLQESVSTLESIEEGCIEEIAEAEYIAKIAVKKIIHAIDKLGEISDFMEGLSLDLEELEKQLNKRIK